MTKFLLIVMVLENIMSYTNSAATTYFIPGVDNYVRTNLSTRYLVNLTTVVTVHNQTLLLKEPSDGGLYCPLITTNPNHQHILKDSCQIYKASYLCAYPEEKVMVEVIPKTYSTNMTAVLPCPIAGEPVPIIRWKKLKDRGGFEDLTKERGRVFVSSLGHLIFKHAKVNDSGVYRCVADNKCGNRCHGDTSCNTETSTFGNKMTLQVLPDFVPTTNKTFLLLNKVVQEISDQTDLLTHQQCKLIYPTTELDHCSFSKIKLKQSDDPYNYNFEGFFYGSRKFTNIETTNDSKSLKINSGLCMFHCTNTDHESSIAKRHYSLIETTKTEQINPKSQFQDNDIINILCEEKKNIVHFCTQMNDRAAVFFSADVISKTTINIADRNQSIVLDVFTKKLTFSVKLYALVDEIHCYQNNVRIQFDARTQLLFSQYNQQRLVVYQIYKECAMRSDEGDYYCSVTNLGGTSLSGHIHVTIAKYDCNNIELVGRSNTSLTVRTPNLPTPYLEGVAQDNTLIRAEPFPCYDGDIPCEQSPVEVTNITRSRDHVDLTGTLPGCCYSVTFGLSNGSVLAENLNISEFMPLSIKPHYLTETSFHFNAAYYQHDRLKLEWNAPHRNKWGSSHIYYRVIRKRRPNNREHRTFNSASNYIYIDEYLANYAGKLYEFGILEVCNEEAGCHTPSINITFRVPHRPNKPVVSFVKIGCRNVRLNISHTDHSTYSSYEYAMVYINKKGEATESFTGYINTTENDVKVSSLKAKSIYQIHIYGINKDKRKTLLNIQHFETITFCMREKIIVSTTSFVIVILIAALLLHFKKKRINRRKAKVNLKYEYTTPHVYYDSEEDLNIAIVHVDDSAGTEPEQKHVTNIMKRFKRHINFPCSKSSEQH